MSNYDLQTARDEAQRHLERVYASLDLFRNVGTTLLGASSLLAAFLSAFQTYLGHPAAGREGLYNLGMVGMMVVYIALVVCCVLVIAPAKASGPVDADEEALRDAFFDKGERDVLLVQISSIVNAARLTEGVAARRNKLTMAACGLLPTVVVIFMLMLLIPRS